MFVINVAGLTWNHLISLYRNSKKYRFFKSQEIQGEIHTLTIKRDSLGGQLKTERKKSVRTEMIVHSFFFGIINHFLTRLEVITSRE